jgi:hypothetical protein
MVAFPVAAGVPRLLLRTGLAIAILMAARSLPFLAHLMALVGGVLRHRASDLICMRDGDAACVVIVILCAEDAVVLKHSGHG